MKWAFRMHLCAVCFIIYIVMEIDFWFKSVCIFSYESSWILISFLFVLCENTCSLLWIGEVYIGEISFQEIIFRFWFSPTDWNKHKPNCNYRFQQTKFHSIANLKTTKRFKILIGMILVLAAGNIVYVYFNWSSRSCSNQLLRIWSNSVCSVGGSHWNSRIKFIDKENSKAI